MSTEYIKTSWQDGDIITADKMNNIENGIKDVDDTIGELKENFTNLIMEPEEAGADLYICDPNGNVVAKFVDGHIVTKNFDSSTLPSALSALSTAISRKIATQQSASDAGKALVIGSDGIVKADDISIEVDDTLTQEGEAADAKAVGDALADIASNNLIWDASGTSVDLYVCDSFGNVVAKLKDGHVVTKNFNSADYVNVLSDISGLQTDVDNLQDATSGIIYRNHDVTDGVYAACRWHQPNASAKQFCLLCGADVHEDKPRMASMIEYLNAIDAFDAGIMLGDFGAWEKDATWYTQAISQTNKPFLTVMGNHDAAGNLSLDSTSYEYLSDFYDKFIAPNIGYADLTASEHPSDTVYYYKDFAAYGIRLIVVNQYDYPPDKNGDEFVYKRGSNCYSQAQITWLVNTLMNTPSNYGVIIAMHSFPGTMRMDMTDDWVSSTWWGSSGGPSDIMDHNNDGYIIMDIVDAWQNGSSLSKTYGYAVTGSWTSVTVNADFSTRGTGEFISYIGGHFHMSIVSEGYNYPKQKMYNCDCMGVPASTQGDMPRRIGTRSEDSLTVLCVDRDLKTVKVLKIGAHFTKDGVDRLYGQYSYGGNAS